MYTKILLKRIIYIINRFLNYFNYSIVKSKGVDLLSIFQTLKKLTLKQEYFSLLFEKGEMWVVLSNGVQLKYNNGFSSITSIILNNGSFEEDEYGIVRNNLSKDSVFFDIGANIGFYSLGIAKELKEIEIHSFEPVSETFLELTYNAKKNKIYKNIIFNKLAIGCKDKTVFITTDYGGSNYLVGGKSNQNKAKVKCMKIDTYVKNRSVKKINFMKIDVEGKELSVLRGAEYSIKIFKPILLIEITEKPDAFHDRVNEDSQETIDFLLNIGYKFYVIDDNGKLIHMSNMEDAKLSYSFHNYLFYYSNVNIKSLTQN